VASAIHNAVRHAEIALVRCKPPASHDAYDLVLRAYPLLWSQDRIKNREAIRLLRKSVALDSYYGRALALLAWCLTQEIVYFWSDNPDQDRESALLAVEAAGICIDDDPTAMAAIGAALSQCGDQVRATAWLERALSLDPSNAWAWGRYGHVALYSNDAAEAKNRFQRSLDLSPYDPFAFNMRMGIAQALGMEGAYHEAIAITRDVLNKHPSVTWANRTLASYSALTGDAATAQTALRKLIVATPNLSVQAMRHTHPMRHIPRYYDTLVEGLERSGLSRK
jgi:tetratricopeptide (TPR) repeat protein